MKFSILQRIYLAFLIPALIVVLLNWQLIYNITRPLVMSHEATQALAAEKLPNNTIAIPVLQITAPITPSQTDPTEVSDWGIIKQDLTHGVSLAEKLTQPGQNGLTVITGHSSDWTTHPYSSVFAGLNYLKTNDIIQLEYNNNLYQYKVIDKETITPTDLTAFHALLSSHTDKNYIALVTCWPVLTTAQRLVVIGAPIQ